MALCRSGASREFVPRGTPTGINLQTNVPNDFPDGSGSLYLVASNAITTWTTGLFLINPGSARGIKARHHQARGMGGLLSLAAGTPAEKATHSPAWCTRAKANLPQN